MVVLNTDIQTEEKFDFDPEETAKKVCEEVLAQEAFPEDAEVSLVLTDAEEVHRLNMDFRGIDRTTDVLSFPGLDFEEPSAFEESIDESCINPDNDCVMLGDIVINAQKVREQSAEYGHSEMREYAFLIAHSMLHLIGYDHIRDEDRELMEEHQRTVMDILDVHR